MPLYGNDLTEEVTPLEAGLSYGFCLDKPDFIGKKALMEKGKPKRRLVGIKTTGRGIVREHQDLFYNGEKVGMTTSGTYCPYLKQSLAMGYVRTDCTEPGTVMDADVRGRRVEVEIVTLPFYKRA